MMNQVHNTVMKYKALKFRVEIQINQLLDFCYAVVNIYVFTTTTFDSQAFVSM